MESCTPTKILQIIPNALIYEEIDGNPLYYQGYQDVLNQTKTIEDITGSSSLQSTIIAILLKCLYNQIDETYYEIYANKTGLHLSIGNNLISDIAIYETASLQNYQYDDHYFVTPPKVVIEVDIKVDLSNAVREAYVKEKTEKLFQFGVERVIWVLSASQQVILAEPQQDWLIRDWHLPFVIVDNHSINIGERLQKRGVDKKSN